MPAGLRPAFETGGTVTAGNASGINDGAAAVVLARESAAARRGLTPLVSLEAVATVIRDAGLDPEPISSGSIAAERTNSYGAAIALGHPVGATGAILALRVAKHLARTDGELGIVTMCIGGGQALAALFRHV